MKSSTLNDTDIDELIRQAEEAPYAEDATLWLKVAELGDARAQFFTRWRYYSGNSNVEQSYEKAVVWYSKAAEQGYAMAQNWLAKCYYMGEGVEQDYIEAVKWLSKAAEQGIAEAQERLQIIDARLTSIS